MKEMSRSKESKESSMASSSLSRVVDATPIKSNVTMQNDHDTNSVGLAGDPRKTLARHDSSMASLGETTTTSFTDQSSVVSAFPSSTPQQHYGQRHHDDDDDDNYDDDDDTVLSALSQRTAIAAAPPPPATVPSKSSRTTKATTTPLLLSEHSGDDRQLWDRTQLMAEQADQANAVEESDLQADRAEANALAMQQVTDSFMVNNNNGNDKKETPVKMRRATSLTLQQVREDRPLTDTAQPPQRCASLELSSSASLLIEESVCQVSFAEQTASEMKEILEWWQDPKTETARVAASSPPRMQSLPIKSRVRNRDISLELCGSSSSDEGDEDDYDGSPKASSPTTATIAHLVDSNQHGGTPSSPTSPSIHCTNSDSPTGGPVCLESRLMADSVRMASFPTNLSSPDSSSFCSTRPVFDTVPCPDVVMATVDDPPQNPRRRRSSLVRKTLRSVVTTIWQHCVPRLVQTKWTRFQRRHPRQARRCMAIVMATVLGLLVLYSRRGLWQGVGQEL